MKLYEISEQFNDLLYNEEMTEEEISEQLAKLNMELENKVENGIGLLKNLTATADAMKAEELRLKKRRLSFENKISRIKDYYQSELTAIGKKKILTARGSMTIAKCGGKLPLKIDDENLIPQDFKKIVYEVDKDKLREVLEDGEIVSGAHLEERGSYLKIS